MTDRFVGPVPNGSIPEQPSWTPLACLSWGAYDVPRIWDMVEHEGNAAAWEQVNGFTFLADFLLDQYRIWREQRNRIAAAWQSPAATEFLNTLDKYGEDLLSDAACARQTAHAWNRTVEALGNARSKIEPLVKQWNEATKDPNSAVWAHTADRLNKQARQIMVETDKAVADARPYIARPNLYKAAFDPGTVINEEENSRTETGFVAGAPAGASQTRVPPVPGYEPLVDVQPAPQLAATGQQVPQSLPRIVEPVPGTPVSLLPIQPGNMYAPFGGAYVLPGPGVGRGGYVVPMPQPPGTGPVTGPRTLMPPSAAGVAGAASGVPGGVMPMPMGGAPGGGPGHSALYRRPNVAWQVDKGVPPVIKVDQDEFVLDRPSPKQEDEFRDWFTDLAYPWRAEFKSSEGAQVTIRTVPE